jgi:hypothetical protein
MHRAGNRAVRQEDGWLSHLAGSTPPLRLRAGPLTC